MLSGTGGWSALLGILLGAGNAGQDQEVLARRGWSELVLVRGSHLADPVHRVELRRAIGPLRQTAVVWRSPPELGPAGGARFAATDEVAVAVPGSDDLVCEYATRFDVVTLEPDHLQDDWYGAGRC